MERQVTKYGMPFYVLRTGQNYEHVIQKSIVSHLPGEKAQLWIGPLLLDQERAAAILPILQKFVETGEI